MRVAVLAAMLVALCAGCSGGTAYKVLDASSETNKALRGLAIEHYGARCTQIARECKERPCADLEGCFRDGDRVVALSKALDALIAEAIVMLANGDEDGAQGLIARILKALSNLQSHVHDVINAYRGGL